MPPNLGAEPLVTHRHFRHGCCFLLVCSTASRQCGLRGVDDVQRHAVALCSVCWSLGSLWRPDRGNSLPHLARREDLWFPFRSGCCRTAWSDSTSRDRAFQLRHASAIVASRCIHNTLSCPSCLRKAAGCTRCNARLHFHKQTGTHRSARMTSFSARALPADGPPSVRCLPPWELCAAPSFQCWSGS